MDACKKGPIKKPSPPWNKLAGGQGAQSSVWGGQNEMDAVMETAFKAELETDRPCY